MFVLCPQGELPAGVCLIIIGTEGKPDLIGPLGSEVLIEPVGSDGPIVTAVRSACPEPSRCYCPYAMMTHEALDAAAACRVPQVAQGRVDSRRAIAAAMGK